MSQALYDKLGYMVLKSVVLMTLALYDKLGYMVRKCTEECCVNDSGSI